MSITNKIDVQSFGRGPAQVVHDARAISTRNAPPTLRRIGTAILTRFDERSYPSGVWTGSSPSFWEAEYYDELPVTPGLCGEDHVNVVWEED